MEISFIIDNADRIGIVSFAISGVAVGVRKEMDLYGLLILGLVTAVGGGILRDVVIDDVPRIFLMHDYLILAVLSSCLAIGSEWIRWRIPNIVMHIADAVGTGSFAVTGALIAWEEGLAWPAGIILAVLTATGGGVIRDVLAARVPRVLRSELNATGAAFGGVAILLIADSSIEFATIVGFSVTAVISILGHVGWIQIPQLKR